MPPKGASEASPDGDQKDQAATAPEGAAVAAQQETVAKPKSASSGGGDEGPHFYESDKTVSKAELEAMEKKWEFDVKKKTEQTKQKAPMHEKGLFAMMDFDSVESSELSAIKKARQDTFDQGMQARDDMIAEVTQSHEDEVTTKGKMAQDMAAKLAADHAANQAIEEGKRAREATMRRMKEEAERRALEEIKQQMEEEATKAEENAKKAVMDKQEEMAKLAGDKAKKATEDALRKEVERVAREAGETARKEAMEVAKQQGMEFQKEERRKAEQAAKDAVEKRISDIGDHAAKKARDKAVLQAERLAKEAAELSKANAKRAILDQAEKMASEAAEKARIETRARVLAESEQAMKDAEMLAEQKAEEEARIQAEIMIKKASEDAAAEARRKNMYDTELLISAENAKESKKAEAAALQENDRLALEAGDKAREEAFEKATEKGEEMLKDMSERARQQAIRMTREHGEKAKSMLEKLAKDQANQMLQEMEEAQESMMQRENRRGRVKAREGWLAAKDGTAGQGMGALFRIAKEGTPEAKLIRACQEGDHKAVVEAIDKGANPHSCVDPRANLPPMHWAARNGHEDVVEKLLDHGVNASTTKYKWLVLHLAAREGHDGVVRALVESGGTPVDQADREDWTAVHWAARSGHSHIVRCLVKLRADVNMKNRYGNTPMHEAVSSFYKAPGEDPEVHTATICRVVKELRLGGADLTIENNLFQRAEDLCKDEEVLAVMKDPKLKPTPPEADAEAILDDMRDDEEMGEIPASFVWEIADRNHDGTLGFSELKRAMRNIDDVRMFFKVPRLPSDEMDGACSEKLKALFMELGKDTKDDITQAEWLAHFQDGVTVEDAMAAQAQAQAQAERDREEAEALAEETEMARAMGLEVQMLTLCNIKATRVPDADLRKGSSVSDPYVKFKIEMEGVAHEVKTETVHNSTDPEWDQVRLQVPGSWAGGPLQVLLFDGDINSDDDLIASGILDIGTSGVTGPVMLSGAEQQRLAGYEFPDCEISFQYEVKAQRRKSVVQEDLERKALTTNIPSAIPSAIPSPPTETQQEG